MPITPISGINPSLAAPDGGSKGDPAGNAIDNFTQVLGDAITSLSRKEATANQAVASLAAGEDIELHQVMLAMQEADIAFQLALKVRNKIVEGYQEIMRTQV